MPAAKGVSSRYSCPGPDVCKKAKEMLMTGRRNRFSSGAKKKELCQAIHSTERAPVMRHHNFYGLACVADVAT